MQGASRFHHIFKLAGGAKRAADLVEFYEDVGYEHLVPAFVKYKWSWVQYNNMDVWFLLGLVCAGVILMCWWVCRCVVHIIRRNTTAR